MRYFHTFDALRFLAFFIVFLHHLPVVNIDFINFFMHSGGIGVQIFFVLSGFLISYILLEEKKKSKQLNLKNFFMRRILRIWPLYYAMLLFAFLTPYILQLFSLKSSNEGYHPNWFFPLLFLENYQMIINNSFANVSPLRVMWSLCIEEHFYILWGIVFYFISNKRFPVFLVISIILSLMFRVIYDKNNIYDLDINTNVLYFSFGGIVAYLLSYNEDSLNKLSRVPHELKVLLSGIIILLYFLIPTFKVDPVIIEPLIIGIFTSILIAFTLCNRNAIIISDSNIFSILGKYTYGMYLFHTIWINFVMKFFSDFSVVFILSFSATIFSSMISYHLFEGKFLKLKKYFK